jgi:hypothetical protein
VNLAPGVYYEVRTASADHGSEGPTAEAGGTTMTELLGSFTIRSLRRHAYAHGAASAMDLRGNTRHQYRYSQTTAEADLAAISNDWQVVGEDLAAALDAAALERLAQ